MIYGDKIRLRAPEREDIPCFAAWLNDPEVRAGLLLYLPFSVAEEEVWFENMLKRPTAEHPMVIEIQHDDSWKMVGNCGIAEIDWRCRSAELGIVIGEKSFWNQSIGTTAMRLLVNHCFLTLNLNRVHLQVYENNPRAIRCYEKVGFVHEGCRRQGMYKDGKFVDILLMSILRSEWQNQT